MVFLVQLLTPNFGKKIVANNPYYNQPTHNFRQSLGLPEIVIFTQPFNPDFSLEHFVKRLSHLAPSLALSLTLCHTAHASTHEPDKNFDLTQSQTIALPKPALTDTPPAQIPTITSDELLTNPQLLEHALYSSVVLGNLPAVQKLLPLYQQSQKTPDQTATLLINMSQALLAKTSGDNKTAIRLYREVLSGYPQMNDVRLMLAQTLFDDHQNEAAKDQFIRLRGENELSPNEQSLIAQYLTALDKRSTWDFSGGITYLYDPNINDAPDKRTAQLNGGTWTFSEPESAQGIGYYTGADKDWNIKNNYLLRFESALNGKNYWTNHDYDDITAQIKLGVAYKDARHDAALLPYHQKRWYAGESYTQETGVRGEWARWQTPKHRISLASEIGKERYAQNKRLDGTVATGSATWLFINNARQYWTLGSDISHKGASDKSRAYNRYALRGSWTQEWNQGISTSLSLNIGKRYYQAPDIINIQRKETEYSTHLSIWSRKVHFAGVTPRLTVSYRTTSGNHPAYEYSKFGSFIQLNKQF